MLYQLSYDGVALSLLSLLGASRHSANPFYRRNILEWFPDSDRAEAKRHNNTHSGKACDPLKPDLWHLSGKGS